MFIHFSYARVCSCCMTWRGRDCWKLTFSPFTPLLLSLHLLYTLSPPFSLFSYTSFANASLPSPFLPPLHLPSPLLSSPSLLNSYISASWSITRSEACPHSSPRRSSRTRFATGSMMSVLDLHFVQANANKNRILSRYTSQGDATRGAKSATH